jgi:hypothetical protein
MSQRTEQNRSDVMQWLTGVRGGAKIGRGCLGMGVCFAHPVIYVEIKVETDRGRTLNITVDRELTIKELKAHIASLVCSE